MTVEIDGPRATAEPLIRAPKTLSIMPTWRCTAACTSCASLSSPSEKTRLHRDSMLKAITEAAALGFSVVVFTGGEATLVWDQLLEGLQFAKQHGLPSRLVSNAFWGRDYAVACARVEELVAAGLDEINFSTGDQHLRFVPLERVLHATQASLDSGLDPYIMVEVTAARTMTADVVRAHPLYLAIADEQRTRVQFIESPWMPLSAFDVESYPPGYGVDAEHLPMQHGCDNVLQTYTLQANGKVGACCGLGLRLIEELNVSDVASANPLADAMNEAESDALKLWIRSWGPHKILAWAAERDPEIKWEGLYAHQCQACLRLYQDERVKAVIERDGPSMLTEIVRGAFLDESFMPRTLNEFQGL